MIPRFFDRALSLLFPPSCVACRARIGETDRYRVMCDACSASVPRFSYLRCSVCRGRLPEPIPSCHPDAEFLLAAATDFSSPPIRELIHALKYRGIRAAAEPLADLLADHASAVLPDGETYLLLPAPLSRTRERERGFNQSLILARALTERLPSRITPLDDILTKTRDTPSQTKCKTHAERAKNVAGSFAIRTPEPLAGRTLLILDDVYTSGATMREMVQTVRNAVPEKTKIIALVVALA